MRRRCWRSTSSFRSRPRILAAGFITALLGTLIIFPSFRLRGHYVTIATLGVGEIVMLVILNWDSLTHGPVGLTRHSAAVALRRAAAQRHLGLLDRAWRADRAGAAADGACSARISAARCGRSATTTSRRAATASRSTATRASPSASRGFSAGIAGALMAHIFSYVNHETFTSQVSLLALTMVILGGLGNVAGAHRRRGRCWSACRSCSAPPPSTAC